MKPLVSVSMICYNAEPFIAEAIEGVLQQQTSFEIELVIGDDCSQDETRRIIEEYGAKYPGKISVVPKGENLGITGNTARNFAACRGKYIAICDGDDVWIDPFKLQKQVDFLENHPDYGLSYTDIETVSETGAPIYDQHAVELRHFYAEGNIFFKLLGGNFINNSTVVFRRKYLENHTVRPDRIYQIQDHVTWLHIAACGGKGHLLPSPTTQYRRHTQSLSINVPWSKRRGNRKMFHLYMFKAVADFDAMNRLPIAREDKALLFRRMLSLIYRRWGSLEMKMDILKRLPRYIPGIVDLIKLGRLKMERGISILQSFNKPATSISSTYILIEEFLPVCF
ncbi:MAG: glycosyltransferase [Saprospirales bacterium]|nr:glycosyltransferase [Saprospirales bacterium]